MKYKSLLIFIFVLTCILLFIQNACCNKQYRHNKVFPEEWYLETNDKGVELYVKEIGVGDDTFVVLHGGFGAEYSYLIDAFEGFYNTYHFVFYDQRGSLRSPCPDSLISINKHVEELGRLRKELNLKKLNIISHSMGGFIAASYLKKYLAMVKGLVLISPMILKTPTNESEKKLYSEHEQSLKNFLERPQIKKTIKETGLEKDQLTNKEKTCLWRIKFAAANIFNVNLWRQMKGGRAFYNQEAGTAAGKTLPQKWNFTNVLASQPYPISIILGDHDLVDMDGKMNKFFFTDIPDVEVMIIKNAGHNSWIDNPKEFRRLLHTALNKYK